LTAHFRAEFVGRGTLAERQQKLNKHMHVLAKLADMHNACVYVTNQVMAKPDQFFGDPTEAIGGNVVGHNSTFRIYLRRGKKGTRVAKLVDAPNLADAECVFVVGEGKLEDAFFLFFSCHKLMVSANKEWLIFLWILWLVSCSSRCSRLRYD
jgi:DNA repair protein RadA